MTVQAAERVETDLSVIEALDFEPEHRCALGDGCAARAAFWAITLCCNRHTPSCEACRLELLDVLRMADSIGYPVKCARCGTAMRAASYRFEPLKP